MVEFFKERVPSAHGAVVILFNEDAAPMAMFAPGFNQPDEVREMICRGIALTYDSTAAKVAVNPECHCEACEAERKALGADDTDGANMLRNLFGNKKK
jgi:hypothetical protein